MRLKLVLEEAFRSIRASTSTTVAATLTVLVAMFVLGLAIGLGTWLHSYSDVVKRQIEIHLYFEDKVTAKDVNGLVARLAVDPRVKAYRYVSERDALKIMQRRYPDLVKSLAYNPLPASEIITPKSADDTTAIAKTYTNPLPPGVTGIRYAKETTKRILHYSNVINLVFAIALVILIAASTLLIANTIRLSLFSRRREIEVMKLVGATNWFVRGPFMLEGLLCGLLGSLLAIFLLLLGRAFALPEFDLFKAEGAHALSFGLNALVLVAIGLILGAAGSGLTLRRFLRV
jgi:cell division transport system permease protein